MLAGAVRLFVHLRVGVIALGTRSQSEHDYLPSLPAPFVTATGTSSLRLRPGYSTHVPLTTIRATTARTIPVQDFAHFGVERVGPSPFGTEPAHTGPGSIRVPSPPE